MPGLTSSDTIRILVSTDNHVGYAERDPIRGDDSWKSFDEVMKLAKDEDVDMVLLAGDLFHENKPSRKSMYKVMETLRTYCLGDKPCELELLSDASEIFGGSVAQWAFNNVNYEDPDINVAIPVFSIHGNHDDPSGEGHFAALDLLQISGLINYYGRTPESDNVVVKPVLLQKGRTKLALFGMSNVRDERLFRTFRDGKVKFFQPTQQRTEWFNLMSVHQNRHAHTDTSFLPENFLPDFLDLVVWGHEHECLIEPRYNPEMAFHVMQPGSSIATSLMPGEAVTKRVAIVSITGKEFKYEPIMLKTVRPFVMREIILAEQREMKNIWKKSENRLEITRFLMTIINTMIKEANDSWLNAQEDEVAEENIPKPLIRLRVEYTAPEGGKFDIENPQRFSNRFIGQVANIKDVVQFHRKKTGLRKAKEADAEQPAEAVLGQLTSDNVKVEKLVREFLAAQSLTILPQNTFSDAVSQFVDKDDKHAMESFVTDALASQVKHLVDDQAVDEDGVLSAMDQNRARMEKLFDAGQHRPVTRKKVKPKPDTWNDEFDGPWEEQPGAIEHSEQEMNDDNVDDNDDEEPPVARAKAPATRGRNRGRGTQGGTTSTIGKPHTTVSAKTTSRTTTSRTTRRKAPVFEESDEENNDIVMVDDNEDEEDDFAVDSQPSQLFVKESAKPAAKRTAAKIATGRTATSSRTAPASSRAAPNKQSTLNFSQSQNTATNARQPARAAQSSSNRKKVIDLSEDEISDDDAFEPASTGRTLLGKR